MEIRLLDSERQVWTDKSSHYVLILCNVLSVLPRRIPEHPLHHDNGFVVWIVQTHTRIWVCFKTGRFVVLSISLCAQHDTPDIEQAGVVYVRGSGKKLIVHVTHISVSVWSLQLLYCFFLSFH